MTDAIGPSYNLPPSPAPSSTDVPALAKQMQNQVLAFADNLQMILDDPSLSEQPSFLQKMSENGAHLNKTVEVANRLR